MYTTIRIVAINLMGKKYITMVLSKVPIYKYIFEYDSNIHLYDFNEYIKLLL